MPQQPSLANRILGWDHLSLIPYLARAGLQRRYADSLLGPILAIAQPTLIILVYSAIFSHVPSFRHGGSYAPMLIAGILPWFALADGLTNMAASLTGHVALIKRAPLPAILWPLSSLAEGVVKMLILLGIAAIALAFMGHMPTSHWWSLPYLLLASAALILPIGLILALANIVLRDTSFLLPGALQIWFWLTPIVWPVALLGPQWTAWVDANPLSHLVAVNRHMLIGAPFPRDGLAIYWAEIGLLALLAFGLWRLFEAELRDYL
ncbi:MAG: ABC transporter permease [Sphingomonadaceae bacterium]|nr:ABC transporter permease [Sphingomonadaceae bacterium]